MVSAGIPKENDTAYLSTDVDTILVIEKHQKQIDASLDELEQNDSTGEDLINLSGEEVVSIEAESAAHVLARPWYNNIDIAGFGGAGFLDTGSAGTRPNGGFLIKEASLFLEGDVWADATFYLEIQTNRLGEDSTLSIRTGEVYLHFRNVLKKRGQNSLGIKVGRIDIPFGEEYLWQDASDNPLISNSAPYPYGWDEGIVVYGKTSSVGWILAVTDGTLRRSIEDHPNKALNFKGYANLWERLYVSASLMNNGMSGKSAMEFGGSHFEPLGVGHKSSVGYTSSQRIGAFLYEIDAKYGQGELPRHGYYVQGSFGKAFLKDPNESFSREWSWVSLEPFFRITQKSYLVARYSEIGTYNAEEGYLFDGKTTAGGEEAFGYDTKRFRRLSLGAGWRPNPHVIMKMEVGQDWYDLIDASPFIPQNNKRKLVGFEVVAIFK